MPSAPFSPAQLAAVFPALSGFQFKAAGSYKSVYYVKQANGTDEVLKIVRLPIPRSTEEEQATYEQELGRVQREVAILAVCASPFVVKLGALPPHAVVIDGTPCFAYTEELLNGSDLASVISLGAGGPPTEAEIKTLLRCLVSAIQVLWRDHRVVHRDIKPGNIFSTRDANRPYVLIDLGIAYDVSVPGLTVRKTDFPHTPLYMAPEMIKADFRETMSYRSDLYAAGLSTYEFAAGVHPLARSGDTDVKTYIRVIQQEPAPLGKYRPEISDVLRKLVDQLLKKNPALRPANMALILSQIN